MYHRYHLEHHFVEAKANSFILILGPKNKTFLNILFKTFVLQGNNFGATHIFLVMLELI